jgi:hypothetical protein
MATAAGPLAYAPRHSREPGDFTANKRQELWAEFDREPSHTGEESGVGMPSAGGVSKTGGLTTTLMPYLTGARSLSPKKKKKKNLAAPPVAPVKVADSGDGTYGHDAGYSSGGYDHDQADPNRFKRMSSAMRGAFNANESHDQSYGAEPATTQPHGSKYAQFRQLSSALRTKFAAPGLGGITSGMPSSSTSMMGVSGAPKAPSAPKMPQAPSMPNPLKPAAGVDPRSDKPAGMNLQHSLSTSMSSADSQAGFGSPQRRQMGGSI